MTVASDSLKAKTCVIWPAQDCVALMVLVTGTQVRCHCLNASASPDEFAAVGYILIANSVLSKLRDGSGSAVVLS